MFSEHIKGLEKLIEYATYFWVSQILASTMKNTVEASLLSMSNLLNQFKYKKSHTKVLFFPDKNISCKKYLFGESCNDQRCGFYHQQTSLSVLIKTLLKAEKSIDVCVFTITSQDLADVLIKKHKEGIIVRVITDYEKMDLNCSQIEQFRRNGIQVRHDKSSFFMHHKYAIVDNIILINGSFNWTKQAITGNQENLIISQIDSLIDPYKEEFKKLWDFYKPDLYVD